MNEETPPIGTSWIRACCRCNGLIYKGEAKYIPSVNYGSRYFMVHKTVALCKKRCDLRVPKDIVELMNMPEQTVKEWWIHKFGNVVRNE